MSAIAESTTINRAINLAKGDMFVEGRTTVCIDPIKTSDKVSPTVDRALYNRAVLAYAEAATQKKREKYLRDLRAEAPLWRDNPPLPDQSVAQEAGGAWR